MDGSRMRRGAMSLVSPEQQAALAAAVLAEHRQDSHDAVRRRRSHISDNDDSDDNEYKAGDDAAGGAEDLGGRTEAVAGRGLQSKTKSKSKPKRVAGARVSAGGSAAIKPGRGRRVQRCAAAAAAVAGEDETPATAETTVESEGVSETRAMATVAPAVTIDSLPDDVLLAIFALLPVPSMVRKGMVCRRWNRLSQDPRLWVEADLSWWPVRHCPEDVVVPEPSLAAERRWLRARLGRHTHTVVLGATYAFKALLTAIQRLCPALAELHFLPYTVARLRRGPHLRSRIAAFLASPSWRRGGYVSREPWPVWPTLRLVLAPQKSLTALTIEPMLAELAWNRPSLPRLRRLHLGEYVVHSQPMLPPGALAFVLRRCPNLTHLTLQCPMWWSDLKALWNGLPHLVDLRLTRVSRRLRRLNDFAAGGPDMANMAIANAADNEGAQPDQAHGLALAARPLEVFHMQLEHVNDWDSWQLVVDAAAPTLRELLLSLSSVGDPQERLVQVLPRLAALRSFTLACMPLVLPVINPADLMAVLPDSLRVFEVDGRLDQNVPVLPTVALRRMTQLTSLALDVQLQEDLPHMPHLRHLALSNAIRSRGFVAKAFANNPRLCSLALRCPHIDDDLVGLLLRHPDTGGAPLGLEELSVCACDGQVVRLQNVPWRQRALRRLVLKDVTVTWAELAQGLLQLPFFECLELHSCTLDVMPDEAECCRFTTAFGGSRGALLIQRSVSAVVLPLW